MILQMLLAVFLGLLVNEMCDVSSHLARQLLRWGARHIPGEGNAERYEEEWLALLEERPGKILKLAFASWMVIRSTFTMRRIYRRREVREQSAVSLPVRPVESLSAAEFEQLAATLVLRDGFATARVVDGPGDMGVDVIATAPDGRTIGFQCKKYGDQRRIVDSAALLQLHPRLHPEIDEFVVITNGSFSGLSRSFAQTHGIHTIDGGVFRRWWSGTESLGEILHNHGN
ncbi:restriction endonuclease [Streptomyces olivaceoviridis]